MGNIPSVPFENVIQGRQRYVEDNAPSPPVLVKAEDFAQERQRQVEKVTSKIIHVLLCDLEDFTEESGQKSFDIDRYLSLYKEEIIEELKSRGFQVVTKEITVTKTYLQF